MAFSTPDTTRVYLRFLERAIAGLRMRVRYGEEVSADELHDFLDALHNVPTMLRDYGGGGGWYVEKNILADLQRYDEKWCSPPTEFGQRLTTTLERCQTETERPP